MSDDPSQQSSLNYLLSVPSYVESPPPSSTEEYLTRLTVALFDELLNKANYETPLLRHWDPNIAQDMEIMEQGSGQDDLLDNIKAMHLACPNYHAEIMNTSVKYSSRTRKATVWILQTVTGLPDGFRKESVNELIWVQKGDEWFCVNHRGLRGLVAGLQNELG